MATNTSKLGLYKVDPATDGDNTFNVGTMMNENWDKIDNKVKSMDEKLEGVADHANNYIHPEKHEASMISVQDEGNKFSGENVEDVLGEVGASLADIAHEQGDLITLQTTEKGNLVGAVNEVFQSANNSLTQVSSGKADIKNAIVGVDDSVIIPDNPSFANLVTAISSISTGKKWASGTYQFTIPEYFTGRTAHGLDLEFVPSELYAYLKVKDNYNDGYIRGVTDIGHSTVGRSQNNSTPYISVSYYLNQIRINISKGNYDIAGQTIEVEWFAYGN